MVNQSSLWSALSSTALISLAPNLILLLFPKFGTEEAQQEKQKHAMILSLGQALAAGGLLGDVFLHALPDAKDEADLELVGLRVLIGFGVFLCLDVLMRTMGGETGESCGHHHHHNHNNHAHQQQPPPRQPSQSSDQVASSAGSHHHQVLDGAGVKKSTWRQLFFQSSVLLNLAADSLHNLTDGMAIGAAFAATAATAASRSLHQGDDHDHHDHNHHDHNHHDHHHHHSFLLAPAAWLTSRGGLATLSILFHEIPHELGDFCVLVQAGFTRNQAVMLQFVTAIAAMIGSVLGVYCVELFGSALVHLTAGGFVYLSTVTLLPSVLEMQDSGSCSLGWRLAQLLAFFGGVALMYSVVLLEGDDHSHHHHHHHHDAHSVHSDEL